MTRLEQWVKKHYPILTQKEINAITEVNSLWASMAINNNLSRFRQTGKSAMTSSFFGVGLELVMEASRHLPKNYAGAKRDPIELDPEYFAKYPSHEMEVKRHDDLMSCLKYFEHQEQLKNLKPFAGYKHSEMQLWSATKGLNRLPQKILHLDTECVDFSEFFKYQFKSFDNNNIPK